VELKICGSLLVVCVAVKKGIHLLFSEVLTCGNCVKKKNLIILAASFHFVPFFFFNRDAFRIMQEAQNAFFQ